MLECRRYHASASFSAPFSVAFSALCALSLALTGCSSGSKASRAGGSGAGASASMSASMSSASASGNPIIIATDRGIEEIDDKGAILRRISLTPARRPRLMPDNSLLFMAAGLSELRQVGMDGKGERPMGMISPQVATQCQIQFPGPWDPARLLYADSDMVVDAGGDTVCLHLSDGRDAADSADVWLRVRLGKQPAAGGVELICGNEPPGADFQCRERPGTSHAARGVYSIRGRSIVREATDSEAKGKGSSKPKTNSEGRARELPVDIIEEAHSSSGRYSLVSASIKRGKYRIRRIMVFDRRSGEVYAIVAGAWPKPMDKRAWRALGKGADITVEAAVRSDVRALARDDLFVVDSLLIVPGVRVVETGAQFAH